MRRSVGRLTDKADFTLSLKRLHGFCSVIQVSVVGSKVCMMQVVNIKVFTTQIYERLFALPTNMNFLVSVGCGSLVVTDFRCNYKRVAFNPNILETTREKSFGIPISVNVCVVKVVDTSIDANLYCGFNFIGIDIRPSRRMALDPVESSKCPASEANF